MSLRGISQGVTVFLIEVTTWTDKDGWQGNGTDYPTFYVVGGTAGDAIANARTVIGIKEGSQLANGIVTRLKIYATPAEFTTGYDVTTWDSIDSRDPETDSGLLRYRWQFIADDMVSDELNATEVRAWAGAHGDTCIVAVKRTARDRWAIEGGDYGHAIPTSAYRRRFGTPMEALQYMGERMGRVPVRAECRCYTDQPCD